MTLIDRFFNKFEKSDGCWNWNGIERNWYGQMNDNGKIITAHRLSWEIHAIVKNKKWRYLCATQISTESLTY